MVEAAEPGTVLIPLDRADLDDILCQQEERVIDHDNTVSFERLNLQIECPPAAAAFRQGNGQGLTLCRRLHRLPVRVRQRVDFLDQALMLFFDGRSGQHRMT
jgi:hypothetical protein